MAFDASSNGRTAGNTSLTVSHTCSGTNRALVVCVVGENNQDYITGATYAGQAMTLVRKEQILTWRYLHVYLLMDPPAGTANIVVSASPAAFIEVNAASYNGVTQTGQPQAVGTSSEATAAALASSVTTTVDDSFVVLCATGSTGTITAGSGTTLRATNLVGAILDNGGGAMSPAGAKTLNHNHASSGQMGGIAVAFGLAGAPADGITITTPAQYKVHQRSGTTGSIAITGTYTGTPTAIEASFNGGAYQTIVASPSGGTYSGTLTGQAQGQGTLTVRFTNATTVNATRSDVGIGDVFLVGGDSISEGRGTNAQSYTHATLKAAKFTQADSWGNGTDGIDTGTNVGSHWPLLATQIMASQGVPVAFVSAGTGGTDVAGSANTWAKPGTEYTVAVQQTVDAAAGGIKAALFHLGPNAAVNATTLSKATYRSAIDTLATNLAADVAGAPKLHLGVFGEVSTGSPPDRRAAIDNLRGAIIGAVDAGTLIKPGPNLIELDYSDGVHPQTDVALQTVAARWWLALSQTYYGGSSARGPRLSSATWNAARNQLTVVFDQALKTGLTFGTGAWLVKDNGTAMTVTGVAYHGTNHNAVVLTTSAAATGAAGTTTVTLASGLDSVGIVIPRSADIAMPSGSAVQIPAEPIYSAAVGEAVVASVSITLTTNGTTPAASLSGLNWAWFDQTTPSAMLAPTDKGTGESTDAAGLLVIPLPNSTKTAGQVGWLIVTNSDGNPATNHSVFAGPATVS